ncbi:MAG: YggT family protein [Gammaproteobacteria bacterium]|nr:MAG: YggT family protein [Gammaproteobacteria bacterium]
MNPYFNQAGVYLVQVLFEFYILAVLLRLLFQLVRADFYNPISQFLVILTNPPLRFLRRVIPGLGGIDLASVVLLLALKMLELYTIGWIKGFTPKPVGLAVVASADLLRLTLYVFIITILARVILSWFSSYGMRRHPATDLMYSLTEPLMRPARRLIPPIGGLDLSPIAVFILLELALILLVQPLTHLGLVLMNR